MPQAEQPSYIIGCFLAFDPFKPPHYKLICIDFITGYKDCCHYKILIYSSESRTWRLLDSSFDRHGCIDYQRAVYWNGAIHWIGRFREVSYYHIDEESVKYVRSTPHPHCYQQKWQDRKITYFKESCDGHLRLIDIYEPCFTKFEVLEMGRDYSGWFVKYNVDLDPLCISFPRVRRGSFFVLFLDRDRNEEDYSDSLFLHTPGHVISCNLKSKTFKCFELAGEKGFLVRYHNHLYKEIDFGLCVMGSHT